MNTYDFAIHFLLIYYSKVITINYEDLNLFLGLTYSELMKINKVMLDKGFIRFEGGRQYLTREGEEQIKNYDLSVFDFTNGIELNKNIKDKYKFKEIKYIPKSF